MSLAHRALAVSSHQVLGTRGAAAADELTRDHLMPRGVRTALVGAIGNAITANLKGMRRFGTILPKARRAVFAEAGFEPIDRNDGSTR